MRYDFVAMEDVVIVLVEVIGLFTRLELLLIGMIFSENPRDEVIVSGNKITRVVGQSPYRCRRLLLDSDEPLCLAISVAGTPSKWKATSLFGKYAKRQAKKKCSVFFRNAGAQFTN